MNGFYKNLLCASAFFVLHFSGRAQNTINDSIFSAAEHLYNFRFQSADSIIKKLESDYPGDYIPQLLSANYYWWLIITGCDTLETRSQYYNHLDKSLALLKTNPRKHFSNDTLYSLITSFAYKARIHAMNNQYFPALSQLNNCIDFVKQSFGREEQYDWFRLTSGLYNYYIIAVKKNYPFLLPYLIFLPEGNSEKGIAFLKQASACDNNLLSTEARYFLMKIYMEEEKNYPEAGKYSELLIKKYDANLLYRYYRFKIFLEEKKIDETAKELGQIKHHAEKNNQLSERQKVHFLNIAKNDLKKYYLENREKK